MKDYVIIGLLVLGVYVMYSKELTVQLLPPIVTPSSPSVPIANVSSPELKASLPLSDVRPAEKKVEEPTPEKAQQAEDRNMEALGSDFDPKCGGPIGSPQVFTVTEDESKALQDELVECSNACEVKNLDCVVGVVLDVEMRCWCRISYDRKAYIKLEDLKEIGR